MLHCGTTCCRVLHLEVAHCLIMLLLMSGMMLNLSFCHRRCKASCRAAPLPAGEGAAAACVAELLAAAVAHQTGTTVLEARQNIWLADSKGLVTRSRCVTPGYISECSQPCMQAFFCHKVRIIAYGSCVDLVPQGKVHLKLRTCLRFNHPRHTMWHMYFIHHAGVTAARWRTTSCPTATAAQQTAPTCSARYKPCGPPC